MTSSCNTRDKAFHQPKQPIDAMTKAWLAEMDEMPAREGLCYFIADDRGLVKIGHSVEPGRRLGEIALQVHRPLTLLAQVTGGRYRESYYHRRFAEHRLHGEWFARHPDILAEIDKLNGEAVA